MKADPETFLSPPVTAASDGRIPCLLLLVALLVWLLGWYWPTAASVESIWARSETFAHGYLIVPISLWLIWRRRKMLGQMPMAPALWPLVLLALLGFVWLLADLAEVVVLRQYALVLMIPPLVAAIAGVRIVWALAFPLAFLVLAVPFGEFLLPSMMSFTADFTVGALRLTGIPVYREGMQFTLPSGNWSVVEACSGLRYLIASFTLGCLYAYLTYRSLVRRLVFITLSLLVPVLANGLRAYMIVMIGHVSNMQLAVGVDHLIYGWVFFGLVIMLLFWAGSFWREDTDPGPVRSQWEVAPVLEKAALGKLATVAAASAAVIALWPSYAARLDPPLNPSAVRLTIPDVPGWQKINRPLTNWQPHYLAPRAHLDQVYEKNGHAIGVFVRYYNNQTETVKLISSLNTLTVTEDKSWATVGSRDIELTHGAGTVSVHQSQLRGPQARLLVWHWFWVEGHYTGNPYVAKLLQAKSRLFGQGDDSAVIILYSPADDRSEAVLREFVRDALPPIERSLNDANRN